MSLPNFLLRTHKGRFLLGVLSLLFLASLASLAGTMVYDLVTAPRPVAPQPRVPEPGFLARAVGFLLLEFLSVLFIVSLFGLIWALCAPVWVVRLLEKATRRLLWSMLILSACVAILLCMT